MLVIRDDRTVRQEVFRRVWIKFRVCGEGNRGWAGTEIGGGPSTSIFG